MGGVQYVIHLVTALARLPELERPEIVLVVRPHFVGALALHNPILPFVDEVVIWPLERHDLERPGVRVIPTVNGLFDRVDVVLPGHAMALPGKPIATWIPDFQHHHLPQFFPSAELAVRDNLFGALAAQAELLILSSHAARQDWERFYPHAKAIVRVMPFRAAPEPQWFELDPAVVAEKHGVRQPFLICCNQLWIHKGHDTLVRALGMLRRDGVTPHLVCTGATADSRDPGVLEKLYEAMDAEGVRAQVHFVGLLPRAEQIALIRRSLGVVQPSRFEGWSTVVEDSRLLGKTILMSDLDVHIEQAPRHGHYFRVGDATDLAVKLRALLPALEVGPNLGLEQVARHEAEALLLDFGRRIVAVAREMPDVLAGKAPRTLASPAVTECAVAHDAALANSMGTVLSRLRGRIAAVPKAGT